MTTRVLDNHTVPTRRRVHHNPKGFTWPSGVKLEVGEKVQINYADGVAVHEMITASCTVSATANTAYRFRSNPSGKYYGSGIVSFSNGSGCAYSDSATGYLRGPTLLGGPRVSQRLSAQPGQRTTIVLSSECKNTNSNLWRTVVGAPALAQTEYVSLNCG